MVVFAGRFMRIKRVQLLIEAHQCDAVEPPVADPSS